MRIMIFLLSLCVLHTNGWADEAEVTIKTTTLPPLPDAVTNNAVTSVTSNATQYLISFAGIGAGLTHSDVHARTFVFSDKTEKWDEQDLVPGGIGRLAATAESVGPLAYVFGGYSVAKDGTEISTPWTHAFDPVSGIFTELAPMPVPVDDALSFTYQDRFIYLVSGWHDLGNVNLVQRYDIATNTWSQATPIPGNSLFGHAGGIVGNTIVYCDGVAVVAHADRRRSFAASDECWMGIINETDTRNIDWRPVEKHPGAPHYRMAAAGIAELNAVVFIGGSSNPYNYDAVGYDGNPSEPTTQVLLFDVKSMQWRTVNHSGLPSMDHRGLIQFNGTWLTVGGMVSGQTVSDKVTGYSLTP